MTETEKDRNGAGANASPCAVAAAIALMLSACGGEPAPIRPPPVDPGPPPAVDGLRHAVQPGETLYAISRRYGVDVLDILRANRIDRPEALAAGRVLVIPGAKDPSPRAGAPDPGPRSDPIPAIEPAWVSPLPGTGIAAAGGARTYPASGGSPVKAPFSARVAYAGPVAGMRQGVLLEGSDGTKLMLADLASVSVAAGRAVKQSDPIGVPGSATGASSCLWIAASRDGKSVDLAERLR